MADANQIDSYLKGKGSPMAGQGRTFVAAGRKYGVDPALLIGISGAESSFGKHLFGPHNAWGWGPGIKFGSWEEGISTVARGLRKGYLDQGLTSPGKIVSKYAPGSDGNDEHGWTSNVETFMRELGVNPASVTRRAASRPMDMPGASSGKLKDFAVPPPPSFDEIIMGNVGRDPGSQVRSLVEGMIAAENRPRAAPSPVPSSRVPSSDFSLAPPRRGSRRAVPGAKLGDPIPLKFQTSIGGEHETAGLAGYPARDYMSRAGSPVVAPMGGTVVRVSGHDPASGPTQGPHGPFGLSLYIRGDDGRSYYLTHLGRLDVGPGQRVEPSQLIGTVGDYARWGGADHVHMGVSG